MNKRKRSGFTIMRRLIVLIAPLKLNMLTAIAAGSLSFICTVAWALAAAVLAVRVSAGESLGASTALAAGLAAAIIFRGLFRYVEQYMNHLIAFKVLAVLRAKVFAAVRRLAPGGLSGRNQGDLISLIAGDMELLEVFYAHTISPIAIALVTTLVYTAGWAAVHPALALTALAGYLCVGVLLPLIFARFANAAALRLRRSIGRLNAEYLDILRGVLEIIQFACEERARRKIIRTNRTLAEAQSKMIGQLGLLLGLIDLLTVLATAVFLLAGCAVGLKLSLLIPAVVGFFFSFGAVSALALLGNGLAQTLACGERLLDLLETKPVTPEVKNGRELIWPEQTEGPVIEIRQASFAYGSESILQDVNLTIRAGEILGIQGPSGCGKSTLLKLIMRFWTLQSGEIRILGEDVNKLNTSSLWQNISYMTQNTEFFDGSIRDNLLIARPEADDQALYEALAKASLADYVRALPEGLDTKLAELGDNFSGGERQRIGLARVFLADSPVLLLDEPSSNLDSLNEGIILAAIREHMQNKTIVLVSHRRSTLRICDRLIQMAEINHV